MRYVQIFVLVSVLGLAGCQDSGIELTTGSIQKIAVGPTVPVSILSIEGLPEQLSPRFSTAMAGEAQAREIAFVDGNQQPRFRLKGYFDAYQSEAGTTVSWVWDVFDTRSQRAQRISGNQPLGRGGSDPWSGVDDKALRYVAARSLDELSGFLVVNRPAASPASSASRSAPQAMAD